MSKITDLAAELRKLLESGCYPAGARFPSEYELMNRYQVARLTANKAVALLTAEGLLERGRRGSGTFVRCERKFPRGWFAMITSLNNLYSMGIIAGASEISLDNGCMLSVFQPGQARILSLVDSLARSDCLGILSMEHGVGYLPSDYPKPAVYLDTGVEDQPGKKLHSVTCDNYGAAHEMMTRIIASGKKEIVMLGREGSLNLKQRLAGFRDAMQEHGIGDAERRKFVMHHGSVYEVRQSLQKILRQFPDVDFIATDSDDLVYRIMDSCNQKEFERMKNIGLSGFGNIHGISDLHRIPTVDQHPWHIGKEAVEALLGILQNGEPADPIRIEVPAEVINTEYL